MTTDTGKETVSLSNSKLRRKKKIILMASFYMRLVRFVIQKQVNINANSSIRLLQF